MYEPHSYGFNICVLGDTKALKFNLFTVGYKKTLDL